MATPNVVPRADQEGGLGTAAKSWGKLFIENPTAGGTAAATISNLDADMIALDINANNTTANILDISSTTLAGGKAINVNLDNSLTTTHNLLGVIIDIDKSGVAANSQTVTTTGLDVNLNDAATNDSGSSCSLYGIKNTLANTSAQGTISQYGIQNTMTGGDTQFGIRNVCIGATAGTTTGFYQTVEDGGVDLRLNSSADTGDYFSIATTANGATTITTIDDDGANANLTFDIDGAINISGAGGIVFNEDGDDEDFRIESVDETHMFFLDASTNRISIGDSTDDPAATLEITNASTAGAYNVPLVQLNNNDHDQIVLDINAANREADIIDIVSSSLTGGSVIKGTVTNSGVTLNNVHGFFDFNWSKSGNTGDGQSYIITGGSIEIIDIATSNHANSTVTQKGLDILIDSGNTNGTNTNTGIDIQVIDATANYGLIITAEDGAGADIVLQSSADSGDTFSIATGAAGATSITTVDDDGAAAHLTFTIDGDFIVNSTDFSINGSGEITDGTWSGDTISVSNGGTGATTLAADCVLTGNGTSAITAETYLTFTNSSNISKLSLLSNQDTGDLFKIETTTAGATTLTTVDDDATAAHIKIQADGQTQVIVGDGETAKEFQVQIDGVAGPVLSIGGEDGNRSTLKMYEEGGVSTDDYFQIQVESAGATTITTVDAAAAAAHLHFNIDGLTKFISTGVEIENGSTTGAPALLIDNNDVDQSAIKIEASNTNSYIVSIDGSSLTTGSGIMVQDTGYERASGYIRANITEGQTSTINRGGNGMFKLDYARGAGTPMGDGQSITTTGYECRMDDNATNHANSTVTMIGHDIEIDFADSSGTTTACGILTKIGGGDANYDIVMKNYDDSSEEARFYVQGGGRLSVETVSDDETGHIILNADGNIALDAEADEVTFAGSGTERIAFNLDATPEMDVTGDFDIDGSGHIRIDSAHEINLDVGDGYAVQFNSGSPSSGSQTVSIGPGHHIEHFYFRLNGATATSTTDGHIYVTALGGIVPQHAHITRVSAVVTELSNLATFNLNVSLGTNGQSVGATISATNLVELIGAGASNSRHTDSTGSAVDIDMGSGTGSLHKVWWNTNPGINLAADSQIYVCTAGTGNTAGTPTAGTIAITVEYFGTH